MVRGVRVSRMQCVSKVKYIDAKKTLNACYCCVFVVYDAFVDGVQRCAISPNKKGFSHFFSKKKSHLASQFYSKMDKKRHNSFNSLIFNGLDAHFYSMLEKQIIPVFLPKNLMKCKTSNIKKMLFLKKYKAYKIPDSIATHWFLP